MSFRETANRLILRREVDEIERGTEAIVGGELARESAELALGELRSYLGESHPRLPAAVRRRNAERR